MSARLLSGWRRWAVVGAAGAVAVGVGVPVLAADADPVRVQVLSIADFHGNLQPPSPEAGGEIVGPDGQKITVGGAAFLATHVKQLQEGVENSFLVSNGDNFAGPPFEADVHQDEPNVEVLNTLGVDFSNAGNHEFDVSKEFLVDHMRDGECFGEVGKDSCFTDSKGEQFHGSDFEWSSANVSDKATDELVLPPYVVEEVKGPDGKSLKVGFVNITTPGTEHSPSSYQPDLSTSETIETADAYAAELTSQGVEAIVLNVHDGAKPKGGHDAPYDGCDLDSGPLIDIAAGVSPDIDAIIGGHLHYRLNCALADPDGDLRPVVEPGRHGDVVNEIDLALDPDSGEVVRDETTSRNVPVTRDVAPDPEMTEVVDHWKEQGEQRRARPVAELTDDFTRDKSDAGESTMGDLAADVNLWAAEQTGEGAADLALVMTDPHEGSNSIANDLKHADSGEPGDADGLITEGEAWYAYGYGDPFLTVTVTGEEIDAAMEQQWTEEKFAPFAVSHNVGYAYDDSRPIGDRVDPQDFLVDGAALDPSGEYRVAIMSYTVLGEDGIDALTGFTDPYRIQPADHEVFVKYLEAQGEITPAPLDRVEAKG